MRKKNNFKIYQNLALLSQVGILMTVYIVGAVVLGNYVDGVFNSSPLALLVFLLIGIVAAFHNVFKLLMKIGTKKEEDDPWKK